MNKELTRSTRRDYLLITLSHAERRDFRRRESIDRILEISDCIKIVAARETHQNEGFHFHIGVHCTNASKNNVTKKVRNLFPEFEGMQCHVQFQKTRSAICTYVTKQDEEPETGLPTVGKRKFFYQILLITKKAVYSCTRDSLMRWNRSSKMSVKTQKIERRSKVFAFHTFFFFPVRAGKLAQKARKAG